MKSIYIKIFSVFLLSVACTDRLEITPEQSLSDQVALSNYNNASGVMTGNYDLLQDLHVFGSQPQFISDYVTDNVTFSGSFTTLQEFNNFQVTDFNTSLAEQWRDSYQAILGCNAVIAAIPNLEDGTDEQKAVLEGEARFVRAAVYYMLANLFSQPWQVSSGSNLSVPLYLEPFNGEIVLLPRNTLAEVYAQIETDLETAESLLPATVAQGRASSGSAAALLSRLFLYQERWSDAIDAADRVLNSGNFSLAPDITFYSTVSSEIIFSIENTAVDAGSDGDAELGSGSWDGYYTGSTDGGRGDGEFSADLAAVFASDPGDTRGTFKVAGLNFGGVPAEYTLKYDDGANNSSDFHMLRVAEVMLNKAEALVELNGSVDATAVSLINDVSTRAGGAGHTVGDFASAAELLDEVRLERRKELCFEGQRREDLLRWGLPLRTFTPANAAPGSGVGVAAGDDLAIYPIPQNEIDQNPELVQNSGY
ncbi:RagB/SusD family nutrient uptake outer membrane protein [Ekhidna sp.]|jgi:hypothetical protein|uniref:RagB/SusD family nutrient uptake outer membrane protein n=1 Tax=Ekhidna sp. TaxID=2608089 RepID=UPI0032EEE5EF